MLFISYLSLNRILDINLILLLNANEIKSYLIKIKANLYNLFRNHHIKQYNLLIKSLIEVY